MRYLHMATRLPRRPALDCSEKSFQAAVLRLAHHFGWLFSHCPVVHTGRGWRTPLQGSEGFPDLVLARAGVLLIVELKSTQGKKRFRPGQKEWITAAGVHGFIWTPADWPEIVQTLGVDHVR